MLIVKIIMFVKKQHNVQCARTAFIFVLISTSYFYFINIFILQSVYQLIFSCTYNFRNLDILQHHMIYHSHSQLLGFQINPSSHIPLLINSLHSHLHLSSFQRFLLLQTLFALTCFMPFYVSCFISS